MTDNYCKLFIIPGVRGRDFWRTAVARHSEGFIFLGDYLDPYWPEGIIMDVFEGLEDIVRFMETNPSNVTLLWGTTTSINPELFAFRYDIVHAERYTCFFWEYQALSRIAYETVAAGKRFLPPIRGGVGGQNFYLDRLSGRVCDEVTGKALSL
jgi:hypothetical protein